MKKTLTFLFISITIQLFANDLNDTNSVYEDNPVFLSIKSGIRYPTGDTSSFDDGVDYPNTSAKDIYKPGLALGLNTGVVIYPLIIGLGMEGGFCPLTSEGQDLANLRRPEWDKVEVEYACFELFIGTYFFRTDLLSCYSTISIGDVAVNFSTDGEKPDNRDYLGSSINLGFELRPFDNKTWYFIINGRYLYYISKPVIPKDISFYIGIGKNMTITDGCSCLSTILSNQNNYN